MKFRVNDSDDVIKKLHRVLANLLKLDMCDYFDLDSTDEWQSFVKRIYSIIEKYCGVEDIDHIELVEIPDEYWVTLVMTDTKGVKYVFSNSYYVDEWGLGVMEIENFEYIPDGEVYNALYNEFLEVERYAEEQSELKKGWYKSKQLDIRDKGYKLIKKAKGAGLAGMFSNKRVDAIIGADKRINKDNQKYIDSVFLSKLKKEVESIYTNYEFVAITLSTENNKILLYLVDRQKYDMGYEDLISEVADTDDFAFALAISRIFDNIDDILSKVEIFKAEYTNNDNNQKELLNSFLPLVENQLLQYDEKYTASIEKGKRSYDYGEYYCIVIRYSDGSYCGLIQISENDNEDEYCLKYAAPLVGESNYNFNINNADDVIANVLDFLCGDNN